MRCDCPECEKLTWWEWLEDEPGPWATMILLAALLAALVIYW